MKYPNIDLETQYSFEQNTLIIHIQILPKTENNQPRTAIVAVGIKNSPPIISSFPFEQLEFPASIQSMLSQLEAELPQRKAAASKLMEQHRIEELPKDYKHRKIESPPTSYGNNFPSTAAHKNQLTLF
jgi:hypothetical protein